MMTWTNGILDFKEWRVEMWAGIGAAVLLLGLILYWMVRAILRKRAKEREMARLGREGEDRTAGELRKHRSTRRLVSNVYIPKGQGNGSAEIDMIVVHRKCLIVVENKNYTGRIYGYENSYQWEKYLGDKKMDFYNPVRQNASHIRTLKQYFSEYPELPYLSVIVFGDRADITNVEIQKKDILVCSSGNVSKKIRKYLRWKRKVLSRREAAKLYKNLKEKTKVSEREKKQHIRVVKKTAKKYKKA